MSPYRHLFSPFRLGRLVLRNRVVFPAHLTNFAEDGEVSSRLIAYYRERARGGVALIITEEQSVHPTDHAYEKLIHAFRPEVVAGYRRLTEAIHREGAFVFAQINHNGGQSHSQYNDLPVWAPSAQPDPMFREGAKAMEVEDIQAVVAGYRTVAAHVALGGFDGAELQTSHSSLIRQFLSPATNRRRDAYGGDLDGRMRFLLEVVEAVRAATGPGFILGVRLCGDELVEGGLTLPEVVEIARRLERTGMVDYLNTSIGTATQSLFLVEGSMAVAPGYSLYISAAIRRAVSLPVIGVGRIKDPTQAEAAIANGYCDLVGMVRAQIADPFWVRRAEAGQAEAIRLCLSCNQECIGKVGLNRPLGCIENPAVGEEERWGEVHAPLVRVARPKRVVVVGGGPAGLKAAAVAARRGHTVTLFERDASLGGQVLRAIRLPGRDEFGDIVRNLEHEVRRLGVRLELGTEATPEGVLALNPDAVVVATGARPSVPAWGQGQPWVRTVSQWLDQPESVAGQTVAVVDTVGGHEASTMVEWLLDRGARVSLITPHLYPGQYLGVTLDLELWYRRLGGRPVEFIPDVTVVAAGPDPGTLTAVHNYTGASVVLGPYAAVIAVGPAQPEADCYFALKGRVPWLRRIGDALAPRRADSAVREGEAAGRAI
ncbi:MAG: mycofactocin system FadH/OYE family oxidoreductase 2 [Firmicutes bacterium]|nr:mycofactocin system FadH/OYE family oxidoreductase 2 [Alicyclobacillaceae bacterium]MCL6497530.1 mycofactocin system FadH/OYE family oxidoreductase 2 [Bacillota bacterium]